MSENALVLAPRAGALDRAKRSWSLATTQWRLEARKHRLMFGGLAAAFLASLPLAALSGGVYGIPGGSAVDGILTLWTFVGLPVIASVYGATAGAELRSPSVEEAEAPLPVPADARLRGALAGAASGFLLLWGLVLAAWLSRVGAPGSPTSTSLASGGPFSATLGLSVLSASFVIGYASRHAVLAGVAGLTLGLAAFVPAAVAALVCWSFSYHVQLGVQGWSLLAALGLGTPAAAAAAGRLVLPRLARGAKVGAALWAAAGLLLLYPLAPAALVFNSSLNRLNASRHEISAPYGEPSAAEAAAYAAVPGRREGRFEATFDGGLYFMPAEGGEVMLVPGTPHSAAGLWAETILPHFVEAAWGWDGRIWAIRQSSLKSQVLREVFSGPGLGPLKSVGMCPYTCVADGARTQVFASRNGAFPPLTFTFYRPLVVPYTGPKPRANALDSAYGATLRLETLEIKP